MTKSFFKQSLWIYALTYFGAIGGYFTRVILTQNFSPEEFGLFYSVLGLFAIISIFNDLGFSETLNYFGVKWYEEKKYGKLKALIYLAAGFQITTAFLITGLMYLFRESIVLHFFKVSIVYIPFFSIMLIYFFASNLVFTVHCISNVLGKYESIRVKDALVNVSLIFFLVLILPFNKEMFVLGIIWTICFVLGVASFALYIIPKIAFLSKIKATFSESKIKEIATYAAQVILGTSALLLMTKIDVFFITYFLNVTSVGYYEIGLVLANIMVVITTPLTGIMFPVTTKYIERKQKKELNHLIQLIYLFYFTVAAFIAVAFFLFPKEIILLMFGEAYLIVLPTFLILACAIFFQIFAMLHSVILSGFGQVKQRNKALYITSAVNISLNLLLVIPFGIEGIALSTLCTFITYFILTGRLLNKQGIQPVGKNMKSPHTVKWLTLAILFFIVSTILLKQLLLPIQLLDVAILNRILKSVLVGVIGTIVYFATLWFGKVFRLYPFAKHFGKEIEKKIPKWL